MYVIQRRVKIHAHVLTTLQTRKNEGNFAERFHRLNNDSWILPLTRSNPNKTTREATFHSHKLKLLPGIYRVSISLCSTILLTVIVTGWFIDTWLQMRLYRRSTLPVVRNVLQRYEETDEPSATYSGLVQPFNVLTTLGAGYSCSLLIRLGIIGISAHPFALCSLPFIRSQSIGE